MGVEFKSQLAGSETALVNACLIYLRVQKAFVWRQNTGAVTGTYQNRAGRIKQRFIRFGIPGISDILGLSKDGQFIAVECKRTGNKLTPHQEAFLESVRDNFGFAVVVYSIDDLIAKWEEVYGS